MRFRFSIRDLFWLTLVAALALGRSIREWQLRDQVTEATVEAMQWKAKAHGRLDY